MNKKWIIGLAATFLIYIITIFIAKSMGEISVGFGIGPLIGFVVGTIMNVKFKEK